MHLLLLAAKIGGEKREIKWERGFTLTEIIVAMSILVLIVFVFTPLFLTSIRSIYFAGDKSTALYEGQSELEVNIAEKQTVDGYEFIFTFGDPGDPEATTIKVPGGLVDVTKTKNEATAWLSGFVPYVPTINLEPTMLIEGYDGTSITLLGRDTDFTEAHRQNRKIVIYNRDGETVKNENITGATVLEDESYDEEAQVQLGEGLTNCGSPYLVALTWEVEEGIEVTVRGRLNVRLPNAVSVGEGQRIWTSPDAESTWKWKAQLTGLGQVMDVIWTGFEYMAVSSSGRIAVWNDRQTIREIIQNFGSLQSIAYGGGRYVAVGNDGRVVISSNAEQWSSFKVGNNHLCAINWSDTVDEYIAAGSGGTIFSSTDGLNWHNENPPDASSITFNGIDYGNSWVAVGSDEASGSGVIYRSAGDEWEPVEGLPATPGLNDIVYDGSRYIAVGDGGTILTSPDGENWELEGVNTEKNLNAVDRGNIGGETDHYLIVGEDGTVITWTGVPGDQWEVLEHPGITHDMRGVAVRWRD